MSNSPSPSRQNINRLPDDILEHLLSFLPTKEVVATSVLSKRWRSLWNYVHTLDKLRLNCDTIHSTSCLSTWIADTISRRSGFIREVDISISATGKSEILLTLPNNFFIIKGLKILKLSHRILIDVPDSVTVCFPNLKILHLESVRYANDKSLFRLLGGCTVLEKLLVNRCFRKDNVVCFTINVPTLKSLSINLKVAAPWTDLIFHTYYIGLNAPMLEYLDIIDDDECYFVVIKENCVRNIHTMRAEIHLNGRRIDPSELVKELRQTQNKNLGLQVCCALGMVRADLLMHPHLTRLHIRIDYRGGWVMISLLLENCPNLQVLGIEKKTIVLTDKQARVPKHLSLFLRRLYYRSFEAHEHEIEMVGFILKNASALELVDLQSFDMSSESKFCFLQKLEKFPRQSETCKFILN